MNNEKVNYDKKCQEIISSLESRPKLLLHSCCGPCSSQVISYLKDYFDITILYYNPNIEPLGEYEKRKQEQIRLIKELNIPYLSFMDSEYNNDDYRRLIDGHEKDKEGGARCHICYEFRLNKCAEIAYNKKYDFFGTTLTVSPYKNAQVINKIGESLGEKHKIRWLYSDFKKNDGYKKSIELSKKYNLYRQDYCGCLLSKRKDEGEV